jgi:CheY-like chemotaxis protein
MEHILLIEDNLADIELITSYLELAGFTHRLFKAQSLQDGLEIIRHNRIDIILLDLALDDTTGTRTLRSLFDDVHNIPVIVLTGNSNELLGMQIIRAGAQANNCYAPSDTRCDAI